MKSVLNSIKLTAFVFFCRCDPVVCDITDYHGSSQSLTSFGRRKRRSTEHQKEDVMVAGLIHISDQFHLTNQEQDTNWEETLPVPEVDKCQEDSR